MSHDNSEFTNPSTRQVHLRSKAAVTTALAVPGVIAGSLVVVVAAVLGIPSLVALLIGAVVAAGLILWLKITAVTYCLGALDSTAATSGANPRLENLVDGLCTTHGFRSPQLHTVDSDAVNAAVVTASEQRNLVITRGALERLARLQLEAVVARQLSQMRSGVDPLTIMVSVSRVPGLRSLTLGLMDRVLDRQHAMELDIEAVRLTCYPPALASALTTSASAPSVDTPEPAVFLWMFVPPETPGVDRLQPPETERLDVLNEV